MKIGDEVYIHGYIDEIRKDVVIIKNDGGYFGTVPGEIIDKYAEQEPCDDVVSRQAVNEIVNDIRDCISVEGYWGILERMKKLPPVRPQEPKTGHWIENAPEYQYIDPPYICSECGNMHLRKTDYCDQCGARMESDK